MSPDISFFDSLIAQAPMHARIRTQTLGFVNGAVVLKKRAGTGPDSSGLVLYWALGFGHWSGSAL